MEPVMLGNWQPTLPNPPSTATSEIRSADGGQTEAPAAGEAEHGPWAVPSSVLLQPGGGGCELFDSGEL